MSVTTGKPGRFLLPGLEIAVGGLAVLLLAGALAADQAWFDRHFLPVFIIRRSVMIAVEQGLRGFIILTAIVLLLVCRRPIARFLSRTTVGGILRVVLATALALGTGELILRVSVPRT